MSTRTPSRVFPALSRTRAPALLGLAVALAWLGGSTSILALPVALLRWAGLLLVPGAAVYLACERRAPRQSELLIAAVVLSPVITTLAGIAGLAAGLQPLLIARVVALASTGAVVIASLLLPSSPARPPLRPLLWMGALTLLLVALTAFLPLTREWWRIRSDAWFHAAVVAQISDFGLPPQDPYFAGLSLQYMWFYHVLVLVLARGLDADPFHIMAWINIQALAALSLGAYQLAGVFRPRAAQRMGATVMMLLGFNAAFWVFLPVKLVKAITGDVRGFEEIKRTYALVPFNYSRVYDFTNVYYNQEFFLDKFMVATAFGLSLAFMTVGWYGAAGYLRARRPFFLVMLAGAFIGMLGFHSLVGFVMLVGIFGGTILMFMMRRSIDGYRLRDSLVVLGVSLASFLASTPYLYSVMHLKEHEQVFPLSVSLPKTIGILIACAFALALAVRARDFWGEKTAAPRFFVLGALSTTLFCLIIKLPGPNTYDKLGYLVFIPLSTIGGIALADAVTARARRSAIVWALAFLLPVNAITFAACFATPDAVEVTDDEARLSDWIRANTPRDALMIDDHERVVFLVTAPRRYFWGCRAYAQQWGYPKAEMSRRLHAHNAIYAPGPIDGTTLEVLGAVHEPLFAVVRPDHRAAGAAVATRPDLFPVVHQDGEYAIVRVDTAACRAAAARQTDRISTEELIRDSGL